MPVKTEGLNITLDGKPEKSMVTITLEEYTELIRENAKMEEKLFALKTINKITENLKSNLF